MKIYGLVLIKNEADIIASVLKSAIEWCDKIIVFDNGSTDNTWQIVQELAQTYKQIVPYISDDAPFRIGLRSIIFNAFKDEMSNDDWWCIRMDGDEFYIDNPRDFLANIPRKYSHVYKDSFDYKLTREDLEEYDFIGDFELDRDKIRYYEPWVWSEIRFLRHSNRLKWTSDEEILPRPYGLRYKKQIRVAHYKFRSPQQMLMRYTIRKSAIEQNCGTFAHELTKNCEDDYVLNRSDLIYDPQDGTYPTRGCGNKKTRVIFDIIKFFLAPFGY